MFADCDGLLAVFDVLDLAAPLAVELLCVLRVPLLLQLQRHQLLLVVELARAVHHEGTVRRDDICGVGVERLNGFEEVVIVGVFGD